VIEGAAAEVIVGAGVDVCAATPAESRPSATEATILVRDMIVQLQRSNYCVIAYQLFQLQIGNEQIAPNLEIPGYKFPLLRVH
jgi:hypothetical protein